MKHFTDRPLAASGLISYRHKGNLGGWIMIGARNNADALNEANRSLCGSVRAKLENLQIWDGEKYVFVT